MKEDSIDSEKEAFDPCHKRTLFVRFPRRIKDKEKIKELYPGIEAVRFKKRINRWCHIRFESEKIAKCAQKALHNKKLEHGKLTVLATKKSAIAEPLTLKNSCVDEKAPVSFETHSQLEDIVKSSKLYKVHGADVTESYSKSCTPEKNVFKGKRKSNVKTKGKKKICVDKRAKSTVSSENENDEERNDEGIRDEIDTKEMTDDKDDISDDGEQVVKGEDIVISDNSDCEISNKSDSENASNDDASDSNSSNELILSD